MAKVREKYVIYILHNSYLTPEILYIRDMYGEFLIFGIIILTLIGGKRVINYYYNQLPFEQQSAVAYIQSTNKVLRFTSYIIITLCLITFLFPKNFIIVPTSLIMFIALALILFAVVYSNILYRSQNIALKYCVATSIYRLIFLIIAVYLMFQ